MTSLATLATHHRAQVIAVDLPELERQRLSAFGILPGAHVQVCRRAALGGPLHVAVGATQLFLRRMLAEGVRVKQGSEA